MSTREYGHEIRTGESQDTCRSVEMRGVSPSGGERLFARSLYSKAVLRGGVLPRMEWDVSPLRPYAEINPFELIFEWQELTSDIVSTLFGLG